MASSIYCPMCGALWNLKSADVVTGTSSEYSFKKGLVGAALLGPIGAVAGINGKNETHTTHKIWHECPKCGYTKEL